jgi:sterol desaturase/sphingolipid hydroxylase (fatty acid hydroxylase superfamily)
MHLAEGFTYHAVALWHLVIPSNPLLAMFQLHLAGFGAINGHIGFEKVEVTKTLAFESHAFLHHLHHKHFDVNLGGDGLVPLDQWFGTWHDGSKAAEQRVHDRYQAKLARMNVRTG